MYVLRYGFRHKAVVEIGLIRTAEYNTVHLIHTGEYNTVHFSTVHLLYI